MCKCICFSDADPVVDDVGAVESEPYEIPGIFVFPYSVIMVFCLNVTYYMRKKNRKD